MQLLGVVAHAKELETRGCPTCGARYPADFVVCPRDASTLRSTAEPGDPWIGRVLADTYQIDKQLGEGGMGRIFQARHLRLRERHVAVKVLSEEYVREPEIVARFEREVESASRVIHPHVIEVYDAGTTADGMHFLVTELLEGEDLGARIERTQKPVPLDLAVRIARQTAQALGAAHAHGVIHRDVKPENVFIVDVDGQPFVKVLDFGISKIMKGRDTKLTRTGAVLGTPAYMAPEQARGGNIDARTDVYGVGATLYTALAGRAPYEGEDAATALSKLVSNEEPPRLRSIASSVPPELELVVQRAMAKDPRDRYQTALELDAALAAFEAARRPDVALAHAPTVQQNSSSTIDAPRGARTAVLFYALVLGVFWIAGASTAAATLVRHARHAQAVTSTESFLVLAGVGLATFVLSASVIGRTREAWPNSVRILELLADRRRSLFFALVVYALGGLGVRFATTFILRPEEAKDLDLALDVGIFAASVAVALVITGLAWLARVFGRLRKR
jgi:serine/threonine protein kinase